MVCYLVRAVIDVLEEGVLERDPSRSGVEVAGAVLQQCLYGVRLGGWHQLLPAIHDVLSNET